MRFKQHQMSALKKQLLEKKRRGVKFLVWKLNKDQIEYITSVLHFRVEPYLYKIRTRSFSNIRLLEYNILKDLHYENKRGKQFDVRLLKDKDKYILTEYGVRYEPIKHKIYLC